MTDWLYKINHWYDNLRDPWRFFICTALMTPFFLLAYFPYWGQLAASFWVAFVFSVRVYPFVFPEK